MERHTMYGLEIQYSKGVNYAQVDINKLSTILIKIKAGYLLDLDKIILQFIWKDKGMRIAEKK